MGKGANAGSFFAGFGEGLTGALMTNRDRADAKAKEERGRRDKLFNDYVLPSALTYLSENPDADAQALEGLLAQQYPEYFGKKGGKKGTTPFDSLKQFLGPMIGMGRKPQPQPGAGLPQSNQPPGVTGGTLDSVLQPAMQDAKFRYGRDGVPGMAGVQPIPNAPLGPPQMQLLSGQTGAPALRERPAPQAQFQSAVEMPPGDEPFGMSPGDHIAAPQFKSATGPAFDEPAAARTASSTAATASPATGGLNTVTGQPAAGSRRSFMGVPILSDAERIRIRVERARAILPELKLLEPTATFQDAYAIVTGGQPTMGAAGRQATPPQIGSVGALIQQRNQERAIAGQPPMTVAEQQQFIAEQQRMERRAGASYGSDRDALAPALFGGRSYDQLKPDEQAAVLDFEDRKIKSESQARTAGAGQGRFESPIGVTEAQDTGTQVGKSSADYAGQKVAPLDEAKRRREIENLQVELGQILGDGTAKNPGLLVALPSETELGGLAPAASFALRRRTPAYRTQAARLESLVDGMATTLARMRGQVGAQTERDAERAYNAVVQLQKGFLDPFGGDTRESATARIQETQAAIGRILQGMPASPTPNAGGGGGSGDPAAARRVRARQVLLDAGKQTDDATITTFLQNNPTFK